MLRHPQLRKHFKKFRLVVHLVWQVYNKAPPLGLTDGVCGDGSGSSGDVGGIGGGSNGGIGAAGAAAVGTMRANDARDNHRRSKGPR